MAEKLGLESVEELEVAIDSLEGIAPDGDFLDNENLAREARVRSVYLDWCKQFGKEPDESRFPQFSSNFLEMEEFNKESGKEMLLNEYADFTEEEFEKMMNAPETEEEVEVTASEEDAEAKVAEEEAAAAAKAEAEAAAAAKAAEEAKAKAAAEAAKAAAEAKKKEEEGKWLKEFEAKQETFLAEKGKMKKIVGMV